MKTKICLSVAALAALCLMMSVSDSHAGTAGTEFTELWTKLQGWVEGVLGRIVTTALVLVGIGVGIARQSLMAFVVGVGGGLGLYATPTIITNIFTATIAVAVAANAPVVDVVSAALAVR